ncbi:MAG: peptidoglycan-binding protein [Candidatus Taylorbacteria bacterium]|nr:peptidoglycan-binding protein [Candidatus Taylorbacteria bacterium]
MINGKVKSVIGIVVGLAMVLSLVGASTVSALTAADIDLLAAMGLIPADKVAAAKAILGGTVTAPVVTGSFTKDLTVGSKGAEVTALQNLLGISPATGYFGSLTKAAVIKYQLEKGISPAAGYVGAKTRASLNGGVVVIPGGVVPTGTDLSVSLAASSPAASAVVAGQAAANLVEYTFTNKSATPAVVTNVTLARGGVSADTTLSNVYLYNGAVRLTDAATVSTGKITFNASNGLFTVAPGASYTVAVKADLLAGTSGQLVVISLTGVTANIPVSAVYPISGAAQNVFSSTDIAAATSTLSAGTLAGGTVQSGSFNQSVWSSTLAISGRAVYLKSLALKVIGSIPADALQNVKLFVSGVQVASSLGQDANGMITFDLSGAPYKIDSSRTIEVRADVVKGSSRTFTVSLQNASDLQVIDSNYNVGLAVALSGSQTSGTWTVNSTTGGSVTVTLDNTLSSGDVITGASNVPLARYTMKAYGEDMKISYLQASSTDQLDNVALYANGIQIGSTQTIATAGTAKLYNIGSSLVIPAGQTVTVEIRGDIKYNGTNATTTSNTIVVALAGYTGNAQGKESSQLSTVPSTAGILGPTMTVKAATVSLSTNAAYSAAQTVVPNTSGVKLGSYTVQTGSAEPVRVTSLTVTLGGLAGAITNVSNLSVAVSGSNSTTPINPQASNNLTVDFTIAANSSKTIDIYGDLGSVADVATTTLALSGYGVNSNVTITKTAVTGQTITAGAGSLAVPTLKTGSGGSPVAQFVVGESNFSAGIYKFISTNGTSVISEMYFAASGTAANIVSVTVGGQTATKDENNNFSVTGMNLSIPVGNAGVSVPVTVAYAKVGTGGVTSNNTTGLRLTGYKYTAGNTTTSTTTLAVDTNMMTLVGSKPTVTFVDLSKSGVVSGTQEIARVTVSADAKGDIKLLTLPLSSHASGAGSATASTSLTVYANGTLLTRTTDFTNSLGAVGTTTAATGTITFVGGYDIAAGQSVTFKVYSPVTINATTWDGLSTSLGANTLFTWTDVNGAVNPTGSLILNYPSTDISTLTY